MAWLFSFLNLTFSCMIDYLFLPYFWYSLSSVNVLCHLIANCFFATDYSFHIFDILSPHVNDLSHLIANSFFLPQQQQLLVTICQTKYFFPSIFAGMDMDTPSVNILLLLLLLLCLSVVQHAYLRPSQAWRPAVRRPLSRPSPQFLPCFQSVCTPESRAPSVPLFIYRALYISLFFGVRLSTLPCLKSLLKHIKL